MCRMAKTQKAAGDSKGAKDTVKRMQSIFRTLKLRGLDPIRTVTDALRTYVRTGALPPLPQASIAHG